MDTFFLMIWFGGMFARYDEKIGFFNRIFWPFDFGERLAESVFERKNKARLSANNRAKVAALFEETSLDSTDR